MSKRINLSERQGISEKLPKRSGIYALLILTCVFVSLATLETDRFLFKLYGFRVPDWIVFSAVLLMISAGISYLVLCINILIRIGKEYFRKDADN